MARTARFMASAALLAFAAGPLHLNAATLTLCGTSVCYEYDGDQAGLSLFGTPTVVGDSLRFLPTTFLASSPNESDAALVSATFVIDRIYTSGGAALESISVSETGNYRTRNAGQISADLYLLAASNSIAKFADTTSSVEVTTPSGGLSPWTLNASINVASAFQDFPGATQDMALAIQNTLEAFGGGPSFTQKNAIFVSATAAVPIPASGLLLLPAFIALRRLTRKRTSI